jgi:hypothetical protein
LPSDQIIAWKLNKCKITKQMRCGQNEWNGD